MNRSKLLIIALLFISTFIVFSHPRAYALFDLFHKSCDVTDQKASSSAVCQQIRSTSPDTKDNNAVTRAIHVAANLIAIITGIYAVGMIIAGGFSITTSAGKADQVAAGRRRIIYSLLGLVVVALAWTLTSFIIKLVS